MMKASALLFSLLTLAAAGCAMMDEGTQAQGDRSAAAGGTAAPDPAKQSFARLDRDNDGMVSRIEAAADPDAASRFEQLDEDRDERLSRSEYDAWGGQ